MSCSKASTSCRIRIFNSHIRITKVNFFNIFCLLGSLTNTLNFFTSPRVGFSWLNFFYLCILLRLRTHLHCTTYRHMLQKIHHLRMFLHLGLLSLISISKPSIPISCKFLELHLLIHQIQVGLVVCVTLMLILGVTINIFKCSVTGFTF